MDKVNKNMMLNAEIKKSSLPEVGEMADFSEIAARTESA